jgi:hypothetical protein
MNNSYDALAKDSAEALEALLTIRKSASSQQLQQQQQQPLNQQLQQHQHQHQQQTHQNIQQINQHGFPPAVASNPMLPIPPPKAHPTIPNPFANALSQPQRNTYQAAGFNNFDMPPNLNVGVSLPGHSGAAGGISASGRLDQAMGLAQMHLLQNSVLQQQQQHQQTGGNFGRPAFNMGFSNSPILPNVLTQSAKVDTEAEQGLNRKKACVRADEVEKALHSKPQRGKKRENLTSSEKKELTKTRNRMHATKTRIRKKARHDELVECEEQYHKMSKEREVHDRRRESVMLFMKFRGDLLNHKNNGNETERCSWKATFGHDRKSPCPVDIPDIFVANPLIYVGNNLLDFGALYEFEHNSFDELRDTSYRECEGPTSAFEYVISGSVDGIGLSNLSSAFAEYTLVLGSTEEEKKIARASGILHVQFCRESDKIASAKILSTQLSHSPAPSISTNEEAAAAAARLGEREFFPSVVSLDQNATTDGKMRSSSAT